MSRQTPSWIALVLALLAAGLLSAACGPATTPTALPTLEIPPSITASPLVTLPPTPPGPTPVTTALPPTVTPGCIDRAYFDGDVTVPDGTIFSPGQSFVKTWRLRNDGTCTWTTDYDLIFAGGDRMGGPEAVPLPRTVVPGETIDLSVTLTAPAGEGAYEGRWQLRNAAGRPFGVGADAQGTFWVRITVGLTPLAPTATPQVTSPTTPPATLTPPTSTPTPTPVASPTPGPTPVITDWLGEYFANRDLAGSPALVRNDVSIDFNWGAAAPAAGLPADDFSVRWTRSLAFDGGEYLFHAIVDDGVRLWVDGTPVIDAWSDGSRREVTGTHLLATGSHNLRIEYYEHSGDAVIQVGWDRLSIPQAWKGEYWSNPNLSGTPALVRNDVVIDFNWGTGSPGAGLPADGFSARWTWERNFEEGTYRFHVRMDDGARLYVDDQLLVSAWQTGAVREVTGDYAMEGGLHSLKVEYFESGGEAQIHVGWERIGGYFPNWKGEYWSNPNLSGDPALVQNEGAVNFNWGEGSAAAGLPADNFSARWTRTLLFEGGTYRFHLLMDDGARIYVDGQVVAGDWNDGGPREVTGDYTVAAGLHTVRVEYYERAGAAQVRAWWEKIAP